MYAMRDVDVFSGDTHDGQLLTVAVKLHNRDTLPSLRGDHVEWFSLTPQLSDRLFKSQAVPFMYRDV